MRSRSRSPADHRRAPRASTERLRAVSFATGLVCIPNRYMHSPVEVVSLNDLDQAAELIARFCLSIDATSDFTP